MDCVTVILHLLSVGDIAESRTIHHRIAPVIERNYNHHIAHITYSTIANVAGCRTMHVSPRLPYRGGGRNYALEASVSLQHDRPWPSRALQVHCDVYVHYQLDGASAHCPVSSGTGVCSSSRAEN